MNSAPIRVFASSPRAKGNTDFMVHNFVQGVRGSGGTAEVTYLRDYSLMPCTACHSCAESPLSRCILANRDDTEKLFQLIVDAPLVVIASPIFFYALPAQLKAFIDRAQRFWAKRERERLAGTWTPCTNPKPAIVSLVAARNRGDKMFEGSLLTLQYFFDLFNIRIADTCQLMGYDASDELAADGVACQRLYEMGAKAQSLVVEYAGRP